MHNWGEEMHPCLFEDYLRESECNDLDWDLKLSLPLLIPICLQSHQAEHAILEHLVHSLTSVLIPTC